MNEGSFAADEELDELIQVGADNDGFHDDGGVFAPFAKTTATCIHRGRVESESGNGGEGKSCDITGGIGGFCI